MGRESKLEIRVTGAEYAATKAKADKEGQTISDYCRALLGLSLSGQKGLVSVRTEPKLKETVATKESVATSESPANADMPAWKVKLLQQQEEMKHKKTRST